MLSWLCVKLCGKYAWCQSSVEYYNISFCTERSGSYSPVVRIRANELKPYLVGDSAYPLASWLQKPFPEATRDPEEIAFNKALSAARVESIVRFWHVEKSLADTRETARQQDFICKQDCYCLCCPSQLLSIKSRGLEWRWQWQPSRSRSRQQGRWCYKGWRWCVLREYIANA